MEWRPVLKEAEAEANEVLTRLRWSGVNVRLEGEDRNKAIKVIQSFLKRYKNCCWQILIIEITGAIRRELLKSRNVIDVNMVTQVVDYYCMGKKKEKKDGSSSDEETDSDEEEEEYNWKDEPDRYLGSDEEEEDSGFEDDSEEDEATLKKMAEAAEAAEAEEKQELEDLHEPTRRKGYIEDMISLSEEKGLSVKKEDEDAIFEMMIPYILGGGGYYDDWMEIFLSRVREHIDRCSSLDNVDTIKAALESKDFFSFEEDHWKIIEQNTTREEEKEEDMADAKDQVNHLLNKTVVPTKEEGVPTPMHQIKQGENGDIMEFEEQETLSPLNLPKSGKESAASAYSSIKESLDRAAANKRKLAQIQPGY